MQIYTLIMVPLIFQLQHDAPSSTRASGQSQPNLLSSCSHPSLSSWRCYSVRAWEDRRKPLNPIGQLQSFTLKLSSSTFLHRTFIPRIIRPLRKIASYSRRTKDLLSVSIPTSSTWSTTSKRSLTSELLTRENFLGRASDEAKICRLPTRNFKNILSQLLEDVCHWQPSKWRGCHVANFEALSGRRVIIDTEQSWSCMPQGLPQGWSTSFRYFPITEKISLSDNRFRGSVSVSWMEYQQERSAVFTYMCPIEEENDTKNIIGIQDSGQEAITNDLFSSCTVLS